MPDTRELLVLPGKPNTTKISALPSADFSNGDILMIPGNAPSKTVQQSASVQPIQPMRDRNSISFLDTSKQAIAHFSSIVTNWVRGSPVAALPEKQRFQAVQPTDSALLPTDTPVGSTLPIADPSIALESRTVLIQPASKFNPTGKLSLDEPISSRISTNQIFGRSPLDVLSSNPSSLLNVPVGISSSGMSDSLAAQRETVVAYDRNFSIASINQGNLSFLDSPTSWVQ